MNDDGREAGPNDFGLTVGDGLVDSGVITNVAANTPIAIDEIGRAGYSFVSIEGDAKCPEALGGTVTLDEGEDLTCTITNDDSPPDIWPTHVIRPGECIVTTQKLEQGPVLGIEE